MIIKATKKPVTIECVKWDGENIEEIKAFVGSAYIGGENDNDKILVISTLEGDMLASIGSNDLAAFKKYVDSNLVQIGGWFNDYSYNYGISPTIYSLDMSHGPLRVSPGSIMQSYMNGMQVSMVSYANTDVFFQMMNNEELLRSQYKVLAGKWPEKYDELLRAMKLKDMMTSSNGHMMILSVWNSRLSTTATLTAAILPITYGKICLTMMTSWKG